MALPLSERLQALFLDTVKKPQLILEVEGLPIFSSTPSQKYALYGDPIVYGQPGLVYGGLINDPAVFPYIDISRSTNQITQQLLVDKGGYSSTSNFDIALVDKNEMISNLISPGQVVDDILGRKARLYLSLEGAAHPQDSILFFTGIVAEVSSNAGLVKLSVASSDKLKTQELFTKVSTELTAAAYYQAAVIQGIVYQERTRLPRNIYVQYIAGGTAGSEVVTVNNDTVIVQIQAGVSTASQVSAAIKNSSSASLLLEASVISGNSNLVQNVQPLTLLDSTTTFDVGSTNGFLLPADNGTLRTYARINDEIIEYTALNGTQLLGCTRAQLGTVGDTHDVGSNVETFYRLQGEATDLALKLMLGGYTGPYAENINIVAFNTYAGVTALNSIFISNFNIDQTLGVVPGDSLTISGSTTNDGTYLVTAFTNTDAGAYIQVDGTLNSEPALGTISLNSKYNVLPAGASLGMKPDQVDIAQFERLDAQFGTQFFSYDVYVKDGVNGAELINERLLYPSGMYAIPRKAKTSAGLTIPPLAQRGTVTLNETNIVGASKVRINRSTNRQFFNSVVYRYDQSSISDRFLRGKIRVSEDSRNRIRNMPNRPLTIDADGVRQSGNFDFIFNTQARRFLDRYQFAAEFTEVDVLFGVGYGIEIGDSVILDGTNLNITDSNQGTRSFAPRLFEVQNKSYSITGKTIRLTLVDTVYSLSVRYAVVSPSSVIDAGSTTTRVKLKESYSDSLFNNLPATKWQGYLDEKVLVHDKNWTYQETVTIAGFDPGDSSVVIVDPPLSVAPSEGLIFDTIKYPMNNDPADSALIKAQHAFTSNQIEVVSGVSTTEFNVALADAADVRPNAFVLIHNADWSIVSNKVRVASVAGALVTTTDSLGITPAAGQFIEYLDFPDGGAPYAFV